MTPQELKNSILQLAIQGKLVEQRADEGTGAELLEKILAAKNAEGAKKAGVKSHAKSAKSAKVGSCVSREEIPDDEKPFEIPESWEWVRLGDVVSNRAGLAYSKGNLIVKKGKMIRVLRGGNIADMGYCTKPDDVMISDEFVNSELFLRRNMLITPAVTSLDHVGKMARIEDDYDDMVVGGFVLMLTPYIEDDIFSRYFLCACSSKYFRDCCRNIVNKSGQAFYNLSRTKMMELIFPLPPLAEQKRIVAKIEELLPLIDCYEKAWSRLEDFNKRFPIDMQKSLLQMAIQGKLVEQRAEEGAGEELYHQIQNEKQRLIKSSVLKRTKSLPAIHEGMFEYAFPETWKLCYIDDIAFVTKLAGFEYTEYIAPNLVSCGVPLFKGKNVQNGKVVLEFESFIPINISDSLPRSQIRKKCLLTPYVGTIGNIAIFDGGFRAHLGSNVGKIELLNSKKQYVLEEYVLYYLRSAIGYSELTKYKKATAQESISIDAIRNVIIPLPPLAEQKRIVAKLEELLSLCDRLK